MRERAAIAAMQSLLAGITSNPALIENFTLSARKNGMSVPELIADLAVGYAESLTERLRKGKEK